MLNVICGDVVSHLGAIRLKIDGCCCLGTIDFDVIHFSKTCAGGRHLIQVLLL